MYYIKGEAMFNVVFEPAMPGAEYPAYLESHWTRRKR